MDAKLNLSVRDSFGKKAKALVKEGNVLANIYGKGIESVAIFGVGNVVEKVVNHVGKSTPIDVELDNGKKFLVLVSEVERDNITRRIHHVTFHAINRNEKTTAEVQVHQEGESEAVKKGLIIVTLHDVVEVEALPADLPESLQVSVEKLKEDGDQISVADIAPVKGVEILTESDIPLAKVETPRSQIEEDEDESDEEVDAADVPSDHGSEGENDSEK